MKTNKDYGAYIFFLVLFMALLMFSWITMQIRFDQVQIRFDQVEQNAKDRYLSTVVAVDFTRDRVKLLDKKIDELLQRQEWSVVNEIKTQIGILRYETKKVIENTRPKTFDELIDEAMSEENE